MAQSVMGGLLATVIEVLQDHIQRLGDAVLGVYPTNATTVFQWFGEMGLVLKVSNSNNHQTTWGVLRAALLALEDYMQSQDSWGTAEFTIFDGKNEVGKGTLK
ncbi:MAG: hypothetical protein FRX48_01025 [Lasallia pustulata]|uniref:Uncharacterized protein n=1 Tax=Lasallia pustulata TaxID=136370 RepID=A0A5M8Q519_9LECA|nr:MAG: hypothetical protein FRX48_01025 [Lasallia pustulata]